MIIAENGVITEGRTPEQIAEEKKQRQVYNRQRSVDYAFDFYRTSEIHPRAATQVIETAEVFYNYIDKD